MTEGKKTKTPKCFEDVLNSLLVRSGRKGRPWEAAVWAPPQKSRQKPRGELGQMATVQGDKIIRSGTLTAWGNPPHSMFQNGKRWKKGMLQAEKGDKGKGLLQPQIFQSTVSKYLLHARNRPLQFPTTALKSDIKLFENISFSTAVAYPLLVMEHLELSILQKIY